MTDERKTERFRTMLVASEFDAVVAVSPENTWYLSDAMIDTQRTLLERLAVVVWAKGAEPIYIVCTNEEIQARRDTWVKDVRGYVEYRDSPMDLVAQALGELDVARGTIGVEKHYLNARFWEELTRLVPGARFVEVGRFLGKVRAVKTPEEIRRMEAAAQATDRAIRTALERVRPGITEKDVGVALTAELLRNGAEMQGFQVLAGGLNTCATHHRAGPYVLRDGDLLRTDFGGIFPGGYYSDLARTIAVGRPSRRQLDLYRALWEEHERLIAMLRPGVSCREVYLSHRAEWTKRGWPMVRPHIGHSIGIGLHEHPLLMPDEDQPIEAGMCIAVEPNCMLPGVEKYHVEDLVVVGEGGPRVVSRAADWTGLLAPAA